MVTNYRAAYAAQLNMQIDTGSHKIRNIVSGKTVTNVAEMAQLPHLRQITP